MDKKKQSEETTSEKKQKKPVKKEASEKVSDKETKKKSDKSAKKPEESSEKKTEKKSEKDSAKKSEKKSETKSEKKPEKKSDKDSPKKSDKKDGKKSSKQSEGDTDKKPKKKKKSKSSYEKMFDDVEMPADQLPQNIRMLGSHVVEDKNIYIRQSVYKQIHAFTRDKTENESGGVLVGNVIEEFGKTNIIIRGFIEAKYSEGTPTTLTFTHESWEYIHGVMAEEFADYKILGWIHTHPDFGIFLSEYDKFIHENFFNEDNQVAYVVDPIQHIEGFYFWINGALTRCKGFYVFDATGVEISLDEEKDAEEPEQKSGGFTESLALKILLGILVAAIVVMMIINVILFSRMKELSDSQEQLVVSYNQSIQIMDQRIQYLEQQLNGTDDAETSGEVTETQPEAEQNPDNAEQNPAEGAE